MTIQTFTGTWTSRATAGNDVITGVGFTPKVIIVYGIGANNGQNNAFTIFYTLNFGVAVGTTAVNDQRCLMTFSNNNVATSDVDSCWYRGIIAASTTTGVFQNKATISAIGADGFTVNWSLQDAARDYFYICIGGDDITNVDVGSLTTPAGTGDQTYTDPNFQPDFLMLFGSTFASDDSAANTSSQMHIGFANAVSQSCVACISEDNVATMDTGRYQRTDKILATFIGNDTATKANEATLSAFTSTGFTLNYTTATAGGLVGYLAIKGIGTTIGAITSPIAGATPVSQFTTTNTSPTGLMLFSTNNTAQTTLQDNNRFTIGSASDTTHRNTCWNGDQDNVANSIAVRYVDTAKICLLATENVVTASSTKNAVADLSSFGSNGFTLSWSTIDAVNAYEVLYIAFSIPTTTGTADMGKQGLTPAGMGQIT